MLHPSYKLQVGSVTIDPETADDLASIRVSLDMDRGADYADCHLRIRENGLTFHPTDALSLSLGYKDTLTPVFKGEVVGLEPSFYSTRVFGVNSIVKLLRFRVNRFYERQRSGLVVKDLAGKANVSLGQIEDGIQWPYYTVDDNKNVYEHIRELAERCGFDTYMTDGDKLAFRKYQSSAPKVFEYGKNIITVSRLVQDVAFKKVRVTGESPSSSKGAETAHWLTKRLVQGSAGSGSEILLQDRIVKDPSGASSVAKAILRKIERGVVVLLDVVGDATVKLDDTVRIQGMPESSLNGEFQVRGVEHSLSKSAGFTTTVRLQGESPP